MVESLFSITVYLRIKLQGYEYSTMLHTENMKRERRKKQTTSFCLSTYFNILIRVLLLIKTLICRLHTMFYTHRHGKKKTDDIYRLHTMFYTHRNGKKEQTTSLCLSTFFLRVFYTVFYIFFYFFSFFR